MQKATTRERMQKVFGPTVDRTQTDALASSWLGHLGDRGRGVTGDTGAREKTDGVTFD